MHYCDKTISFSLFCHKKPDFKAISMKNALFFSACVTKSIKKKKFVTQNRVFVMWPPKNGFAITPIGISDIIPADGGFNYGKLHISIQTSNC